jgi:hypothetical protein
MEIEKVKKVFATLACLLASTAVQAQINQAAAPVNAAGIVVPLPKPDPRRSSPVPHTAPGLPLMPAYGDTAKPPFVVVPPTVEANQQPREKSP